MNRNLFVPLILDNDLSVTKAIQEANKVPDMFISPIYSIPPVKRINLITQIKESPIDLLEGLFSIIFPKSVLDKNISVYIKAVDSKLPKLTHFPNSLVAYSQILDTELRNCFASKDHVFMPVQLNYYSDSGLFSEISSSKCFVKMNCEPLEEIDFQLENTQSKEENKEELKEQDMDGATAKEKWKLLSKKLSIDQEIINRLQREVDEKKQSLKLTGAEIVDLRRSVKMLQSENTILKKKLGEEEGIQIQKYIASETAKMSSEELKSKLLKLANSYKIERIKNEELEKALQASQIEIASAYKLKEKYDQLLEAHEAKSKKLHDLQRETQKLSIYKETIQKQEKVIAKLESILGKASEAVKERKEKASKTKDKEDKKAKDAQIDMDQLKIEISKEIASALKQRGTNIPATDIHYDWEDEKAQLENDLFQAESKIKSLEMELTKSAEDHAKEISRLMVELNDMKAQLD